MTAIANAMRAQARVFSFFFPRFSVVFDFGTFVILVTE